MEKKRGKKKKEMKPKTCSEEQVLPSLCSTAMSNPGWIKDLKNIEDLTKGRGATSIPLSSTSSSLPRGLDPAGA